MNKNEKIMVTLLPWDRLTHTSHPRNRASIMKNGILPSIGKSYFSVHGLYGRKLKPVVFLMVGELAFDVSNDIWEVDHSELIGKRIEKDGFLRGALALMVHEPISPNKIKLIHKSRKRRNKTNGSE